MLMTVDTLPFLLQAKLPDSSAAQFTVLRSLKAEQILKELPSSDMGEIYKQMLSNSITDLVEIEEKIRLNNNLRLIKDTVMSYVQGLVTYDFLKSYCVSLGYRLSAFN